MMEKVARAATDGGETVARLLQFARRDEDAPRETINVHHLLDEVAQLTAPRWRDLAQAEGRPITVRLDVDPTATIEGQPAELRQALTNLIFNAVDAMPRGGTLTLRARQRDDRVEIAVSDTGIGMTPDVRARVFEPFFSTKGERGTGLGLAQVFGIAERHTATVEVSSSPREGTTFLLSFPAPPAANRTNSPAGAPSASRSSPPGVGATPSSRRMRVLAVDDNDVILEMIAHVLAGPGCDVVTASSAEEALTRLEEQRFDVVVSDLGLGNGMDGWGLAAQVRDRWTGTRFLLATGWKPDLHPAAMRARGVDGILGKPYRIADLAAIVAAPV